MGPINNIPALVQMMAWRRSGAKPLSEPMMVSLPTPIYEVMFDMLLIHKIKWGSVVLETSITLVRCDMKMLHGFLSIGYDVWTL